MAESGERLLVSAGPGPPAGEGECRKPRAEGARRRDVLSPGPWVILALVVWPVVAVISLGLLIHAFVDAGGNHSPLWLVVLALSCGASFYFFTTEAP
jgi:hypothetical protein